MADPAAPDQTELLGRARAGDRRAFETLVEDLLESVHGDAVSSGAGAAHAADLTAAALIRAWSELPSLGRDDDLRPWLTRIVREDAGSKRLPSTGATDLRQVRHVVRVGIAATPQRSRWRVMTARFVPRRPRPPLHRTRVARRTLAALATGGLGIFVIGAGVLAALGSATPRPVATPARSVTPAAATASPSAGPSVTPAPTPAAGATAIAYAAGGDIWLAGSDGRGQIRLAHVDGLRLEAPVWSPKGDRLLFVSDEPAVLLLDLATGALRRLGAGSSADWSPDGSSVVMGNPLRIVDLTSGLARRLNPPPDVDFLPGTEAWSPNGDWIAVVGDRQPFLDRTPPKEVDLYRVSVRTGSVRRLKELGGCGEWHPAWSHSSLFIAVEDAIGQGCRSGVYGISVVDTNGTQSTFLAQRSSDATNPRWSPDDRTIAYLGYVGSGLALSTVEVASNGHLEVAEHVGPDAAWTPEGDALLYVAETTSEQGSGQLTRIATNGVPERLPLIAAADVPAIAITRLLSGLAPRGATGVPIASDRIASPGTLSGGTPAQPAERWSGLAIPDLGNGCGSDSLGWTDVAVHAVVVALPSQDSCSPGGWSPDGRLFLSTVDGSTYVFEAGRAPSRVAIGDPGWVNVASWSPRGDRIELEVCDTSLSCAGPRTIVVSPDGNVLQSFVGHASWSPDEQHLAVERDDGTLEIGSPDGTRLVEVGRFPAPSGWSPDGTRFLFVRDGQAWTARIDGADIQPVTEFPYGGATGAIWSPDGRWIIVRLGVTSEWLLRVTTGESWLLSGIGGIYGESWAPDGHAIAMIASPSGVSDLVLIDTSHDRPTAVRLTNVQSFLWSPDSLWIALTTPTSESTWAIDVANGDGTGRRQISARGNGVVLAWMQ